MKTRLLFVPFQILCFQPYNGFDVEISEDKVLDYMRALRKLDELHTEISAILQPQAEAVDQKVDAFFAHNGLRSLIDRGEGQT